MNGFLTDFRDCLGQADARDFCLRASRVPTASFYKSWIGINFAGPRLLSLKLYFTFYEPLDEARLAGFVDDRGMREDFLRSSRPVASGPALDPTAPGSGFTFCVKVGPSCHPTYGFHHRSAAGPMGWFFLYGEGGREVKRYYYLEDPRLKAELAARTGFPWVADCDTIEYAQGNGHGVEGAGGDEKFILIGNFPRIRPCLFAAEEEAAVAELERSLGLRAACGGIFKNQVKSAYLVTAGGGVPGRVATVEELFRE